jgi:diaminohydroxyphosphoribosylaminopyrimidine deaminase/5-amino-6-(5-phosphoribosylamino)uracil reductase
VGRVTVALVDPNPLVAGKGIERMRSAGIQVEVMPPESAEALGARELNVGFLSRMERGLPWVRMKMAASLDGITALPNGQSQWITGEAARTDGHAWRKRAGAVLTGIGTVREDDPMLDVRLVSTPRQPHLVIVDSRLETPPDARLFQPLQSGQTRAIWIYHAVTDPAKAERLRATGAELIHVPGPGDKVDLAAMLHDLAKRNINELHVEAGHKLNGSLLREGLVDELLLYLAPVLLGQGAHLAHLGPFDHLASGLPFGFHALDRIGNDLRILARKSPGFQLNSII